MSERLYTLSIVLLFMILLLKAYEMGQQVGRENLLRDIMAGVVAVRAGVDENGNMIIDEVNGGFAPCGKPAKEPRDAK